MRSKRQVIALTALGIAAYLVLAFVFVLPPVGCVYVGQSLESCAACLKQVEIAKTTLQTDKRWAAGHEVRESDVKEACGYVPRCPGGGKYAFNKIGEPATCSLAGNPGPKPKKKIVGLIFWRWDTPPSAPHEL